MLYLIACTILKMFEIVESVSRRIQAGKQMGLAEGN